jgi:hypothetical protein
MNQDYRRDAHGASVNVVVESQLRRHGMPGPREIVYRQGSDFLYTEDLLGFGEDLENDGTVIIKGNLLMPWTTTMLQFPDPNDLDDSFVKEPPYYFYCLGSTSVRDNFSVEVRAYETLRHNQHPGICQYRGCMVVDEHVEGIVLKSYRYTLKDAID